MTETPIQTGDRVIVTHLRGDEIGTVVARTSPAVAELHTIYSIRFDDGTYSSWPAARVRIAA